MRKTVILLTAILFVGCKPRTYEKPWVIIYKSPNSGLCNESSCRYKFITNDKSIREFCEDEHKYNIGDTIK